MDLIDRMLDHDPWLMRRLLDGAAELPGEKLDEPVAVPTGPPDAWFEEGGQTSVRSMLERLIYSKEIWTAAFAGRDHPERGATTLDDLRDRHERAGAEFARVVRDIRDRNAWDTAFVDALCDPPETFTFGGMVMHVLTRAAHRRSVVVGALRELGVEGIGSGDPIEWERRVA